MKVGAEGFALGLAVGPYCFAACAPFVIPYLLSENKRGLGVNAALLAKFLAGRLAAYLIFSCAASAAGMLAAPALPAWVEPASMAITAVLMLFYAAGGTFRLSWCASPYYQAGSRRIPLVLGFLTGINVCPPFVLAFVRLAALASFFKGLILFAFFFVATSLYLIPPLAASPWFGARRLEDVGRLALILAGLWYLAGGLRQLFWLYY